MSIYVEAHKATVLKRHAAYIAQRDHAARLLQDCRAQRLLQSENVRYRDVSDDVLVDEISEDIAAEVDALTAEYGPYVSKRVTFDPRIHR